MRGSARPTPEIQVCGRRCSLERCSRGATRGYRLHPQLTRFREQARPVESLNQYLAAVHAEACRRGYAFDPRELGRVHPDLRMTIEKAAAFDAYIAYFGTYTLLQRFGGASIRLT